MFSEMVSSYMPIVVAASILVPAIVVHVAMFIESVGERKWKTARSA